MVALFYFFPHFWLLIELLVFVFFFFFKDKSRASKKRKVIKGKGLFLECLQSKTVSLTSNSALCSPGGFESLISLEWVQRPFWHPGSWCEPFQWGPPLISCPSFVLFSGILSHQVCHRLMGGYRTMLEKPTPLRWLVPELWVLHPEALNPKALIWKRKWVLFDLNNIYNSLISLSTMKTQGIIRKSRYFAILEKLVNWQAWIFADSGTERRWLPWHVAHTLYFVTISATTVRIFLDTHTEYETLMISGLFSASSPPMYLILGGPAWFFQALESSWSLPPSSLHPFFLSLSTL